MGCGAADCEGEIGHSWFSGDADSSAGDAVAAMGRLHDGTRRQRSLSRRGSPHSFWLGRARGRLG